MKRILPFILFIFMIPCLHAQKDTTAIGSIHNLKSSGTDASNINLNIYPVPVRDNILNIKCDQPVTFLKITNIIGQDIFRSQYNNPQTTLKIILDNPRRGMYLVTIIFDNGVRIVKKIMIEQSE